MPELTVLAQGVLAWLQPEGGVGRTNAGAVIDADGITVVDTMMLPSQAGPFADALDELGLPIRRVVLTSSHIEFVGGTDRFRLAAFYGTPVTSAHLDQPPNIAAYQAFMPDYAPEFTELVTRPVSHVVKEATMLTPAVELVPLPGNTMGNLVAHVPSAGLVFAGGVCSFGTTPLAFQADLEAWAAALDLLIDLGATVVPGHGPVGGPDQVRQLQAYLRACVAADGDPAAIPPGPWDGWSHRDLDVINVERAHMLRRGDQGLPPSMARAIGLT